MKSFNLFAIALALSLAACGSVTPASRGQSDWIGAAIGANHSQQNQNYDTARAVQREERRIARNHAGCVPGLPCASLVNALPEGMAIIVARVNDHPIDTNPDGGEYPAGFFMPREHAAFNWPLCTQRGDQNHCVYTFSGIATYTTDVNDIAPSTEPDGIEYIPTMDPRAMGCFHKQVLVSKPMIMNRIYQVAIDQNDMPNDGRCNFDLVPKGMVTAKK